MNMMINSTNIRLAPQIVAETEGFDDACGETVVAREPGVTQIRFSSAGVHDFRGITILLREAIGQVRGLSDSLIGACPSCAKRFGIPIANHKKIRRFQTVDGLVEFEDYIFDLIERIQAQDKSEVTPFFRSFGEDGFTYILASKRAGIHLMNLDGTSTGWCVTGFATFKVADIAERQLTSKGFTVIRT